MNHNPDDLYDSISLYERLGMKNEFLYSLRQYTYLVVIQADFMKLKDLIIDYKLTLTNEEEQTLDQKSQN